MTHSPLNVKFVMGQMKWEDNYEWWPGRNHHGGIVARLLAGWQASYFISWHRQEVFVTKASRPIVGPTQPPIKWVLETFTQGQSSWGVKLTTHLCLVLTSAPLYAFMACTRKPWMLIYFTSSCCHGICMTWLWKCKNNKPRLEVGTL